MVLDVDTGVDDALAILLALRSPAMDVRAITCVAGNADVDQVVANTLRVLDAASAPDIPVARGMTRPLVEPPRPARHVHGEDGMGDLGLPRSQRSPVGIHAVELLRTTLASATEPITLIPLAPLTNIAVLVRTYPELLDRIDRIVLMGGAAAVGNATAAAEFNVWHDPEAAAIVLDSGVPTTMYGLDVFYEPVVPVADVQALVSAADPARQLAGRLMQHQLARFGAATVTLGDAGAVAAVLRPDLLWTARHPVRVELAGTWTRGRTVVDQRPRAIDLDHDELGSGGLVDVALRVDGPALAALFLEVLRTR
ncbi:MAG: nucleoside hydrolase [Sporichthyaceae bacterium]|nr:nucleoside hydrolase [Sporichthyaceae bacterium]